MAIIAKRGEISSILDSNLDQGEVMKKMKQEFIDRYKSLLGDRFNEFIKYSTAFINKAIRINPLKTSKEEFIDSLNDDWILEEIPWTSNGYWIKNIKEERFDIGNLPQHQLGWIYIQEAASMIPVEVLNPSRGSIILDACASPGSKTGQIAGMVGDEAVIIANDIDYKRMIPLASNLERLGVRNTILSISDASLIHKKISNIDFALVDAPCSGTGTIRKSLKVLDMWSPGLVKKMASIQKKILASVFQTLKPSGIMVYSTCTMEPEENEGVVSWFLDNFDARLEEIKLEIKMSEPIKSFNGIEYNKEVRKTLRIWPMDNNTEGFFVAKIRKNG
ncbi:RsmB/NOP family class I SAM-dependent RNA methyltransferase [Candidatus Woesearchaeota archaeon]|nr:RsmB/NOP family class I SAM-dependent RNA methyltransferase [Candidatus Woesearchaeota archaeon]